MYGEKHHSLEVLIAVKKALARGVALLGVKVTGFEPPRLTFVTDRSNRLDY